jgi:hypothetical protein
VTRGLAGGEASPPTWGRWLRQIGAQVTSGAALMQGVDKAPLLVLSRVDKGRAALLLSDQMWLWARGYDGGGPHLDLLRRLAHWLMKEPDLEEEALRLRANGRDLTVERQSLKGEIPQATVTGPDGKTTTLQLSSVAPGLSRATLSVDEDGLYRANDGEHVALAVVGPQNPVEFQDVVSTPEKLKAFAEATGGGVHRLARGTDDAITLPRVVAMQPSPSYSGSDYVGIKRAGASALIGVRQTPLAVGFLGLALLLGALVWVWRREGGARG